MSTESTPSLGGAADAPADEFAVLQTVIAALRPLDSEARNRILDSVVAFLGLTRSSPRLREPIQASGGSESHASATPSRAPYSADKDISPKDFLFGKMPKTDVERIACLAFYLTHYRDTPHFKTLDISTLNTEAAQPKFANTADSTSNAVKMGYLVPSTKGHRQLSGLGERFVQALPDRDAAKEVLLSLRRRRRRKRVAVASEPSEEG